jgi:hypothetical protein
VLPAGKEITGSGELPLEHCMTEEIVMHEPDSSGSIARKQGRANQRPCVPRKHPAFDSGGHARVLRIRACKPSTLLWLDQSSEDFGNLVHGVFVEAANSLRPGFDV